MTKRQVHVLRDGWNTTVKFTPEPITRCCARCKTPYMCGNHDCSCHLTVAELRQKRLDALKQRLADIANRKAEEDTK